MGYAVAVCDGRMYISAAISLLLTCEWPSPFSSNHLEKSLQLLMDRVDDMSQEIVKYNTYSRNLSKQQQQKHQVLST